MEKINSTKSTSENKSTLSNKTHILNAFDTTNLNKYFFNNPVMMSIFYFLLLISFVVILFSNTYITVSNSIIIFLVYLILRQLYNAFFDTKGMVKFTFMNMVVPVICIIIIIICNRFLPKNAKYILGQDNELISNIQQPVMGLVYTTIIYSIVFIMLLMYVSFRSQKFTILSISAVIIFIGSLYLSIRNNRPPSLKEDNNPYNNFVNTLIATPIFVSVIYIICIIFYYLLGLGNIKNTSFSNNIKRFGTVASKPQFTEMEEKLNELNQYKPFNPIPTIDVNEKESSNIFSIFQPIIDQITKNGYTNTWILFITIIFGILTVAYYVIFYDIVVKVKFDSVNSIVGMIINIFIMWVVLQLLYFIFSNGTQVLQSDMTRSIFNMSNINQGNKMVDMPRFIRTGTILLLYNIFIVIILNNNYTEDVNKEVTSFKSYFDWIPFSISNYFTNNNKDNKETHYYSTLLTITAYVLTFYIYYRYISNDIDIKKNTDMLLFMIILIFFIIVITYINNSKTAMNSYLNNVLSPYIYSIIAISIIFGIGLILLYLTTSMNSIVFNIGKDDLTKTLTYYLFIVCGALFLYTLITWCFQLFNTFTLKNTDGSSSIVGIILNIAIIITILAILFRMMSYGNYFRESSIIPDSPLSQLIINSIFYIPCLLIAFIDLVTGSYKKGTPVVENAMKNLKETKMSDIILLILIIVLYIIYYSIPYLYTLFSGQGGQQLLKEPIYLNREKALASYSQLNPLVNSTKRTVKILGYDFSIYDPSFNASQEITNTYNYAFSCWVFIDGNNRNEYYTIINYGDKPKIQYRGKDNSLIVTMKMIDNNNNLEMSNHKYESDNEGNIIIYKSTNFLLQKWNNIVINYNSGIVDVFLNGKLEKSFNGETLSYMHLFDIIAGENDGLNGGICNVVYFNEMLNIKQVYYLYNSVKEMDPPIMLNFYNMLYLKSLKIENVTEKVGLTQIK